VGQDEPFSAKTVNRSWSDGHWNAMREPASFCGQLRAKTVINFLPNVKTLHPDSRRFSFNFTKTNLKYLKSPFGIPLRE
jgi:hypothetical protein